MNRLFVLTILRILDERWIPGTFETRENSNTGWLEITNINNERYDALAQDIVPNTSPSLRVIRLGDGVIIGDRGVSPFKSIETPADYSPFNETGVFDDDEEDA